MYIIYILDIISNYYTYAILHTIYNVSYMCIPVSTYGIGIIIYRYSIYHTILYLYYIYTHMHMYYAPYINVCMYIQYTYIIPINNIIIYLHHKCGCVLGDSLT